MEGPLASPKSIAGIMISIPELETPKAYFSDYTAIYITYDKNGKELLSDEILYHLYITIQKVIKIITLQRQTYY